MQEVRYRGPGHHVSREEQVRRAAVIEELYLQYRSPSRVARMMAEGIETPDKRIIRVSRSRTHAYIKQIEDRWIQEAEEQRAARTEWHRRSIVNDIRSARGDKKWSAVATLRRLLADVDGVVAPQRLSVGVDAGASLLSFFDGWSAADKDRYARTGLRPGESDPTEDEDPFPPSSGSSGASKGNGAAKPNGGNGAAH